MKRKLLCSLLSFACVISLAGCGSDAGSSTGGSDSSTSEAVENEEEEEVILTLIDHTSEDNKIEWEDYVVEGFMKEHPNVTIEVQRMSMDAYTQTISAKFASDDAPDIFYQDSSTIIPYIDNGYVADLSDTDAVARLVDGAADALSRDGKVYGLPINSNSYVVTYNKDAFEKAGITEVPVTEKELYEACDKLEAAGITPFGLGYSESWVLMGEIAADYINNWLIEDPGAIADLEARRTKFVDSEYWHGALKRMGERLTYGNSNPFGTDWATACTMLTNGECAMIINGDWTTNNAAAYGDVGSFGAFALPVSDDAAETKIASLAGGQGFCLNAGSKNLDIAKEFLNYMTDTDSMGFYMSKCQEVCLIKDVPTDNVSGALQDVQTMLGADNTESFNGNVNFSTEYFDTFNNVIAQFLLDGGTDVEGALMNLDTEFDRIAEN